MAAPEKNKFLKTSILVMAGVLLFISLGIANRDLSKGGIKGAVSKGGERDLETSGHTFFGGGEQGGAGGSCGDGLCSINEGVQTCPEDCILTHESPRVVKVEGPVGNLFSFGWRLLLGDFGLVVSAPRTSFPANIPGSVFHFPDLHNFETYSTVASIEISPANLRIGTNMEYLNGKFYINRISGGDPSDSVIFEFDESFQLLRTIQPPPDLQDPSFGGEFKVAGNHLAVFSNNSEGRVVLRVVNLNSPAADEFVVFPLYEFFFENTETFTSYIHFMRMAMDEDTIFASAPLFFPGSGISGGGATYGLADNGWEFVNGVPGDEAIQFGTTPELHNGALYLTSFEQNGIIKGDWNGNSWVFSELISFSALQIPEFLPFGVIGELEVVDEDTIIFLSKSYPDNTINKSAFIFKRENGVWKLWTHLTIPQTHGEGFRGQVEVFKPENTDAFILAINSPRDHIFITNLNGCLTDTQCDDGLFCNGQEVCNDQFQCEDGPDIICLGGDNCPAICTEETGCGIDFDNCNCVFDTDCDDGQFCNGEERCNLITYECENGNPPLCNDGVSCSFDRCDPFTTNPDGSSGACRFDPLDSFCSDGLYCTGDESCQPGNESADINGCVIAPDVSCDDGVACTIDECDELQNTCINSPNDAACEEDGLFCNGGVRCDTSVGCIDTPAPLCEPTLSCATPVCLEEAGICSTDIGLCGCPTGDDSECDNGLFCDGIETCNDTTLICEPGTAVVCNDEVLCTVDSCSEISDSCEFNPSPFIFCNDNIPCTLNICDPDNVEQSVAGDGCFNPVSNESCNDGQFCNGAEICAPAHPWASQFGCVQGVVASCSHECSEESDVCTECGDGVVEPGEECDSGAAVNADDLPDVCRTNCKLPWCGDGVVDNGESCDDGNRVNGDGCSNNCVKECDDGTLVGHCSSERPLYCENTFGPFQVAIPKLVPRCDLCGCVRTPCGEQPFCHQRSGLCILPLESNCCDTLCDNYCTSGEAELCPHIPDEPMPE